MLYKYKHLGCFFLKVTIVSLFPLSIIKQFKLDIKSKLKIDFKNFIFKEMECEELIFIFRGNLLTQGGHTESKNIYHALSSVLTRII